MDSYLKQQEVEGVVAKINIATAAADKATAALACAKPGLVVENAGATTAVPTVPKLTLKRKAPGGELSTDADVRKVLSSYSASEGHTSMGSVTGSGSLSPAVKRRRARTSGSTTVSSSCQMESYSLYFVWYVVKFSKRFLLSWMASPFLY